MASLKTSIMLCAFLSTTLASTTDNLSEENLAGNSAQIGSLLALTGEYVVGYQESQEDINSPEAFNAEINTLKDRMSILEKVAYQEGQAFKIPSENSYADTTPLCKSDNIPNIPNSSLLYQNRVLDSIKRTLVFVETHLDKLDTNSVLALMTLKVVDDKRGGELQKEYPISEWASQICATLHDKRESDSCNALIKIWKSRDGHWKPESIITTLSREFTTVGSEKEVIWGKLNGQCQLALLTRCEVPYVCERTLFDPTPRAQYMLTHQMFQRILAKSGSCSTAKDLIDPEVDHRLCAKIYKEAQLIHALETPGILRDLFAEQIGICGYMGYTNFMRQDWLELILSWQSKSDYGCFVRDKMSKSKFMTTDTAVKRRATKAEQSNGLVPDEYCLPHFTSVSLMAVSTYWNYLEEKCMGADNDN